MIGGEEITMDEIESKLKLYSDSRIKEVSGSESFILQMLDKFELPKSNSEDGLGNKEILFRIVIKQILLAPSTYVIFLTNFLVGILLKNYPPNLKDIFGDTGKFSSFMIEASIGMAALMATVVLSSHLLKKEGNEHLLDWEARTELTKIVFMNFIIVFSAFILPFVELLFVNQKLAYLGTSFIVITLYFTLKTFFYELKLIRRIVGYSVKHER